MRASEPGGAGGSTAYCFVDGVLCPGTVVDVDGHAAQGRHLRRQLVEPGIVLPLALVGLGHGDGGAEVGVGGVGMGERPATAGSVADDGGDGTTGGWRYRRDVWIAGQGCRALPRLVGCGCLIATAGDDGFVLGRLGRAAGFVCSVRNFAWPGRFGIRRQKA